MGTAVAIGDACTVPSGRHVVDDDDQSETELFLERRCVGTQPQPIGALGRDVAVRMALDTAGRHAALASS